MKNYKVTITETRVEVGELEVEARNKKAAVALAKRNDLEEVDFEIVDDRFEYEVEEVEAAEEK